MVTFTPFSAIGGGVLLGLSPLALGAPMAVAFVAAMLAGMTLFALFDRAQPTRQGA